MIDLIAENKFQKLKEKIQKDENALAIHQFLAAILNGESIDIDGESFDSEKYQEEFFEGLKIYKALNTSEIPQNEFTAYSEVLVKLAFTTGGFIRLLANTAMEKGVFLSDIAETYQVSPNLRAGFQEFIELLNANNDVKSVANISAAKAQITTSVANLLSKEAIGNDMLQFAASYVAVGQKEHAIQIYRGIMNDFEAESVKNSSGLFPELSQVDTRPTAEIEIFEKAKTQFEKLSGEELPEVQRVSVNDSEVAQKLAAEVHKKEKELLDKSQNESKGFFSKLKSFFTGK